ncbi:MAG: glucosaminidase domain-containing protein [Saprospiraceae bacterium]
MRSNLTQQIPNRNTGNKNSMQAGYDGYTGSIINWALLWSRLWMFLKRVVAELWYLVSRRQRPAHVPQGINAIFGTSTHPFWAKWSVPLFKVAVAIVLFTYVMQRDIQFTLHFKAPFGHATTSESSNANNAGMNLMGFAQAVGFGSGSKSSQSATTKLNEGAIADYMGRFTEVAQAEMQKYGIPASVKMAQAILESEAGQSMATKVDNNHFGNPMGNQTYESAWRNWREHSLLIVNQFPNLLSLGNDYRAWARGLEKAGYSPSPNYANQLLEIIDRFHLEQLDDPTI